MQTPILIAPEKGIIDITTIELPPLQPHQVLLKTQFSAISPGTELAFLHGLPNTTQKYPFYPGYSACAEVIEVGSAVEGFVVGQRVAAKIHHTAYAVVNANECAALPDSLLGQEAAVFRLGSIAMQGIHKAKIQLGWDVAVLGLGPIGNLASQLARAAGAGHVTGIDPVAWRRELALDSGLDAVADPAEITASGADFDCVIEATGIPAPVNTAFQIARRLGHVVLLASSRGETENVNFYRDVHKKGLTIFGAHESIRPTVDNHLNYTTVQSDNHTVIKLMTTKRIRMKPLVSDVVSFEDATTAYERLHKRNEELMTIVFRWI